MAELKLAEQKMVEEKLVGTLRDKNFGVDPLTLSASTKRSVEQKCGTNYGGTKIWWDPQGA